MQDVTQLLQKGIDDQEKALNLATHHNQDIDEALATLAKLKGIDPTLSTSILDEQRVYTDEIKQVVMSNDWTIKKSRSQIASSNSAMSSVFIAIERAREVEAALAQSCKTDGKQRNEILENFVLVNDLIFQGYQLITRPDPSLISVRYWRMRFVNRSRHTELWYRVWGIHSF
eukprot:GHVH01011292.1.p1 GENE.GHVH01011292.1~~GHVH01011292.1.p1  ORF type:complete len:172 (-),score=18.42 GHVH01011292.1:465-980(-)